MLHIIPSWGIICNMHCDNDKKINKKLLTRLKRIEGQVRGLQKMINEDKYCIDIITQSSAARSALLSFESEVLKEHLKTCASRLIKSGNSDKAINEIVDIYKSGNKR